MKLLKSKLFIICAVIAVVLALTSAMLAALGRTDILGSAVKTVAMPFEWCGNKVAEAFDGFISVFTDYDRLAKENEELREQIESMEKEKADASVLREENEWLKDYLGLHASHPEFKLTSANIISRESGNYATILTLNCGTVHGIKKEMPVITADGVFGYVSEVGLDWCKVVSIIETTSKVGVYTDRSGVIGTVEGSTELREDGMCVMSYSAGSDIKVGDRVYTSGTGSIYPGGLLLGTVESIKADETTRTLIANIRPAIDFTDVSNITGVMVINGYLNYENNAQK